MLLLPQSFSQDQNQDLMKVVTPLILTVYVSSGIKLLEAYIAVEMIELRVVILLTTYRVVEFSVVCVFPFRSSGFLIIRTQL